MRRGGSFFNQNTYTALSGNLFFLKAAYFFARPVVVPAGHGNTGGGAYDVIYMHIKFLSY
jgi:hypothetical protein